MAAATSTQPENAKPPQKAVGEFQNPTVSCGSVQEGRIEDAKRLLLEAGKSPGSPQMNSFGPNMTLAKDLLEKGEREVVLEHFELCRKFWKMDGGRLDQWSQDVKAGRIPEQTWFIDTMPSQAMHRMTAPRRQLTKKLWGRTPR